MGLGTRNYVIWLKPLDVGWDRENREHSDILKKKEVNLETRFMDEV